MQMIRSHGELTDGSNERDVLAFDEDFAERSRLLCFRFDFVSLIQDNIHELIEAEDLSFKPEIVIIEQPYFDSGLALQKLEYDGQRVVILRLVLSSHFIRGFTEKLI